MKILCPIDFSRCSINAVNWIAEHLKDQNDIDVHLIHCLELKGFKSLNGADPEMIKEVAKRKIKDLAKQLHSKYPSFRVESSVYEANPKAFLVNKLNYHPVDLVVMGSVGLSQFKEMTIGSVSNYVIDNIDIPTLLIPDNYAYQGIRKTLIGVDKLEVKHPSVVDGLNQLLYDKSSEIIITQVDDDIYSDQFEYDYRIDDYLREYKLEVAKIKKEVSISNTLNKYAALNDVQLICYLHRKRSWFKNIFHFSSLRESLYDLEFPLLVLSD